MTSHDDIRTELMTAAFDPKTNEARPTHACDGSGYCWAHSYSCPF